MMVNFELTHLYISFAILAVILVVLRLRGRSLSHLFFVAIFGCYLIGAVSVAVFPLVIRETSAEVRLSINLIPFDFGTCFDYLPQNCIKDIFKNILLTVPFGFGIHFVATIKPKHILWLTLLIGCSFELAQLVMALGFHAAFRSIDINDVILNTMGAFIGYLLFKLFGWLYLKLIQKLNWQPRHIFAVIHEVVIPYFGH